MFGKKLYIIVFVLLCQFVSAQHDSIRKLAELIITDSQLKNNSHTQTVLKLNDSVIRKNQTSLTTLLNYNSVVYFKENGLGMVSSPSFRGTTAQQTAVIWNGININSQLNGQTDFNTLSSFDYNSVAIRAGGGSSIYGSGAVGGSIHLNNGISFEKGFSNRLRLQYGSYETINTHYGLGFSNEKWSVNAGFSYNKSDNDYKYPGTQRKNENGQFYNSSFNTQLGYRINIKNTLRFYSQLYDGERHFSGTTAALSKGNYQNTDARNLAEWEGHFGKLISKTKLAFVSEQFKYFEDKDSEIFSYGKVESMIAKYDATYPILNGMNLNLILDFTQNKGVGSSFSNHKRSIGGGSLLVSHAVTDRLYYEASVRKETTDTYQSPVLFSAGSKYRLAKFYTLNVNVSKNFRIPTFNDLYWEGSGNPNLKPEHTLQYELGNTFHLGGFSLKLNAYQIQLKDMLRWLPQANGLWQPVNTDAVTIYGGESLLEWKFKCWNHHHFTLNGTYAYTISENDKTQKQLIYVPYHKATAAVAYSYKRFSLDIQLLYNGEVFTSSDNAYVLDDYAVSNIGVNYDFGKNNAFQLGARVLNVWNEEYENVAVRPMPGRNFTTYLTLNF